ncbi:hypothetical protein FBU59_003938 [Linderina macrospora]|uniref:Uncharacterized protein n=1 Tax=Linderina macrospora TaxID=4868 RepID=A0ACC1J773_9FUNG|nr:hypothetical protein FBU59_003938 [Linderina macrospora]
MKLISLAIAALAAASAYAAGDSSAIMATADLKGTAGISAHFEFSETDAGVSVTVSAKGLAPRQQYPYHIHQKLVPANGDCTATGGHLDPDRINVSGKPYKCDPMSAAETCELGDLSGIHGNMTASNSGTFAAQYEDSLLAFSGTNTILGHSLVIHSASGVRLVCGNIVAD